MGGGELLFIGLCEGIRCVWRLQQSSTDECPPLPQMDKKMDNEAETACHYPCRDHESLNEPCPYPALLKPSRGEGLTCLWLGFPLARARAARHSQAGQACLTILFVNCAMSSSISPPMKGVRRQDLIGSRQLLLRARERAMASALWSRECVIAHDPRLVIHPSLACCRRVERI